MNHQKLKEHLRVNGDVFKYLYQSVSNEQARWKPGKDRWSILEVINHLFDEEREDFRNCARLKASLKVFSKQKRFKRAAVPANHVL